MDMEVDLWCSRVNSSKCSLQAANSENIVVMDNNSEEDGDAAKAACFPCPFCYVDIQINLLCSHLQEEHCFDLKNAEHILVQLAIFVHKVRIILMTVCPLCAANLGKDATEHFIVQHANSMKRRRKPLKSGFLTSHSTMLGKELSSFLGSSTNVRENEHDYASPGPKGTEQDKFSESDAPVNFSFTLKSGKQFYGDENDEWNKEERRSKAEFVQDLIESTLFLNFHTS
ncbi:hypothetical protein ACFE04_026872 [Oxalis oulophora]